MISRMRITFIRHGFAEHNQGFLDEGESAYSSLKFRGSKLTQLGHKQTLRVIVPNVDIVYVSPLIRCIESARNIFGYSQILHLSDGLLETQGPYPCNWREPKGLIDVKYKNVDTQLISPTYTIQQETETSQHIEERAFQTLEYLILKSKKMNAKSIAIVTHNDWLESIFRHKFENAETHTIEMS
jgi:broad specificity phosphatase PhoE